MKTKVLVAMWLAVAASVLSGGCEFLRSDEEKQQLCEENQLAASVPRDVVMYVNVYQKGMLPDYEHKLIDAEQLKIFATVTLIDCYGDRGKSVQVTSLAYPKLNVIPGAESARLLFASTMAFPFTNNREYLEVKYKLTATFADYRAYQSSEVSINTKYYDKLSQSGYIEIDLNTLSLTWTQIH